MIARNRATGSLLLATALAMPTLAAAHPDLTEFTTTAFAEEPTTVDCTLADGSSATCHEIVVGYLPEGLEAGPFCPATLDDAGGVWDWTGDEAGLYRIDRAFLELLDGLGYRFYDDDGTVHVVDNATERPDVDHACIAVSADETVMITMRLPTEPVMADTPSDLGTVAKIGVGLDGVPIFADAPSIQQTGHMPALDTCGGHIDPGGWYHWHATATDIQTTFAAEGVTADCAVAQDSAALFGYAFDGFPMFGSAESDATRAADLDVCNGHQGQTALGETYHYHASEEFPNLPPCLVGVQAADNFSTTGTAGIGAEQAAEGGRNEPPRPDTGAPGQMPPGFDEAAQTLGVTTETLLEALGNPQGGSLDLAAAADSLGVSEEDLRAVLPSPPVQ